MDNNRKRFLKVKPRIGALPKGAFARLVTFLLIPCRVLPCRGLLYAVYAVASAFLLSAAQAGDARDGAWWRDLSQEQKEAWAVGWFDGTIAGTRILGGIQGTPQAVAYQESVLRLSHVSAGQLTQGIGQFYATDFRNLSVPANDVALLVAMYARGLEPEQAVKLATELRALYK